MEMLLYFDAVVKSARIDAIFQRERTNAGASQRRHDGLSAEALRDIATDRAHVSPTAAFDVQLEQGKLVFKKFKVADLDLARRQIKLDTFTGHFISTSSIDHER